ncbi:hypothetical protein CBR_g55425 [Chara braunii]|uniref:Uncharacterized protein n=1 Tax=Chara braunii TaxID=69332 RepID=A0A388K7Q0_CHABU|nr:hypothetical protein CBR_g55425 [Chara braunii]|eukprot:GBG66082.1 hypothetical protein CBR_g55425 [Chara braunii]
MVYAAPHFVKVQVEAFVFLEVLEGIVGWLLFTVVTIGVGALGQFMTDRIFWTGVGMSVLEASSKFLRGRIHRFFFHGMSCSQVSTAQGSSYRYKLGTYPVLGGRFRVTFAYVFIIALVRLLVMVAQLSLGIHMHQQIPSFKKRPDYPKEMGNARVVECIQFTYACLLSHSVLVGLLIFLPRFWASLAPYLSRVCGICVGCGGCCGGGCCGSTCCQEAEDDSSALRDCPLIERMDAAQRVMEMGVTWYVHRHRHWYFTAVEARSNKEQCGLPGYWFYSVEKLVKQVGDHLHDLADCNRHRASRRQGRKVRKELTMAFESLLELSREQRACECGDGVPDETATYLQDLPQTSRCRIDADAGRDFARAGGYLVMLQVLKCCPQDSEDAQLAASILSGFAAGLSVLTWQPGHSREIIHMLEHPDFSYCTREVLEHLGDQMRRTVAQSIPANVPPDVPPDVPRITPQANAQASASTCHFSSADDESDRRSQEGKQDTHKLQGALFSAICSYADMAGDVFAHLRCPERSQASQSCRGQGNGRLSVVDPQRYIRRLSNAFTTFCPLGWFLGGSFPPLDPLEDAWLETVRSSFTDEMGGIKNSILHTLLQCASSSSSFPCKVVTDCIRTLSCLLSRRMIYWHRFDMRHEELPEPFIQISSVNASAELRSGLMDLVVRCSNEDDPLHCLPVFSKLQLAKILMSQDIRDKDEKVVQVLLSCLSYWRRSLGAKELDWLACETVEMLLDLLRTTTQARADIKQLIASSPGGLECLALMLRQLFPRMDAVRIFNPRHTPNRQKTQNGLNAGRDGKWAATEHKSIRCSAAAAALLEEMTTIKGDGPDDYGEASILLPNCSGLLNSLKSVINNFCDHKESGAMSNRHGAAEAQGCPCGSFEISPACMQRLWGCFKARCLLLFVESLGHPAWLPPCSWTEAIDSVSQGERHNSMEDLEYDVNVLLAARNAVSFACHLILSRWPMLSQYQCVVLFPSLVRLLRLTPPGPPELHAVLVLKDRSDEIRCKIMSLITVIAALAEEMVNGRTASSLPQGMIESLRTSLNELGPLDNVQQPEDPIGPQDQIPLDNDHLEEGEDDAPLNVNRQRVSIGPGPSTNEIGPTGDNEESSLEFGDGGAAQDLEGHGLRSSKESAQPEGRTEQSHNPTQHAVAAVQDMQERTESVQKDAQSSSHDASQTVEEGTSAQGSSSATGVSPPNIESDPDEPEVPETSSMVEIVVRNGTHRKTKQPVAEE